MKLSNNKILITGGSKGIGLALAKKFMSLGNQVIITGRNQSDLDRLSRELPNAHIIQGDLSLTKDIDKLVLDIEERHPDLNILINNAGVQYNYDMISEKDVFHKIGYEINTNLTAPILLTSLLLPTLNQNPNAAVVNVASALGLIPKRSAPVYCATKAGIHIFSKSLRYQMDHVKVFEIIPPLVDTAMTEGRNTAKISPEELAECFARSFENDQYEINIGKVKFLRFAQRVSPRLADLILKNN